MPVMDGIEATAKIRELISQNLITGPCIPQIIALTAYATEGFKQECLKAGMDDVITKPISATKLGTLLHQLNLI
jgi:CheY-like chemotaxis protein